MNIAETSTQKVSFHVFGWFLVALTVGGWALLAISGMLDRLAGVSGVYSGMEKESDIMTAGLVFVPLLPLWVGAMVLLRKAAEPSGVFGRIVYFAGIAGIVAMLLVVARLATLD